MEGQEAISKLEETIKRIGPLDEKSMEACWRHWDTRCKPLRGFGRLEEMVVQMAGICGDSLVQSKKRAVVIMGADNGVVEEGVSQTDSGVTWQVLENMGNKISSVCVMSQLLQAEVFPVNIGMNKDAVHPRVKNIPVRYGTGNITKGPAMSREECVRAIAAGIDVVTDLAKEGYDLVLVGEMGIGNTTTSAACACALFDVSPETITGRGAGLSSEGLERKIDAVKRAVRQNHPDKNDAIGICASLGGLDIAGMTGCYLGAAAARIPAWIDGVISGIAACFAAMLCPASKNYMVATHQTLEPAGELIMQRLQLKPLLYADMHLGEATGAAATLPLLDQALHVYHTLPGFDEGNVEAYQHLK